jgi:hypothetical protein
LLAETLRLNTTLSTLDLENNGLGEGGRQSLAETMSLNTTLTVINLLSDHLREGGGRTLAETLLLNTFVTSLELSESGLGVEQESALWQPGTIGEGQ